MNYRHAYHAGNFADCFKHALLVFLIESLSRKPSPYFVLDTHAGAGHYDLDSEPARRSGEATEGIRRLLTKPSLALSRYLGLVQELGLYPGSPDLIRAMARASDRLVCCELHPEDCATLRHRFRRNTNVEVHARSGWEALGSLLPPRENRGLVFIDPPFEAGDEFSTLEAGLRLGHRRFGHGIIAAWYPIKQMASVRAFHAGIAASGIRDIVAIEMHLRKPTDPDRLNGCGLLVINPPYQFEGQAHLAAIAVLKGVGTASTGAGIKLIRLANE